MGIWARWWWRSQPSTTDWALICPGVVERSLSILPTDAPVVVLAGGMVSTGRQEVNWLTGRLTGLAPGWMTMDRVLGAGLMGSGHTFGR